MKSSNSRNLPEGCPRPLYSRDTTQEDHTFPHRDQSGDLGDNKLIIKEEYKEEDEKYGVMEQFSEEHKELCKDTTSTNPPEGFTRPLCAWDTTQEDHTVPHHDQMEEPKDFKPKVKEEENGRLVSGDQQSMVEESPLYPQNSTERDHTIPHQDQGEEHKGIKPEVKEEEENTLVGVNPRSMEVEGPLHSRNSTQEDHNIPPHHDPSEKPKGIKLEVKEDEGEVSMDEELKRIKTEFEKEDPASMENGEMNPTWSLQIDSDGDFVWNRYYACSECGKSFDDRGDFVRHQRIHNGGEDLALKGNHDHHQKSQTEKPRFPCSMCGKNFNDKRLLLIHERSHTGERPFLCSECGKYFVSKGRLVYHQKRHTGECPYPCSECKKCFAQKGDLVKHQRIHTGERPYTCSECGKSFTEKKTLSNHEKIHTGERPYSCSECGKSYISKHRFKIHQMKHTGKRPHTCEQCGKGFCVKSTLVSHLKTHMH